MLRGQGSVAIAVLAVAFDHSEIWHRQTDFGANRITQLFDLIASPPYATTFSATTPVTFDEAGAVAFQLGKTSETGRPYGTRKSRSSVTLLLLDRGASAECVAVIR
jgi:hypothetical protein